MLSERVAGWKLYRIIVFVPFVLAIPIVAVVMKRMFQFSGPVNEVLRWLAREFGLLVGTPIAMVLAHTCLAVPFVVTSVTASLSGIDPRLEQAAPENQIYIGSGVQAKNWKIIRDNFNESYHLPTIHPELSTFINDGLPDTLFEMYDSGHNAMWMKGHQATTRPPGHRPATRPPGHQSHHRLQPGCHGPAFGGVSGGRWGAHLPNFTQTTRQNFRLRR